LFQALNFSFVVHFLCGAHPTADALANELSTLATNKMPACGNQSDWRTEVGF
jgi:hypothetical protein